MNLPLKEICVLFLSLAVASGELVVKSGTNPDGSTWTTWKQTYNRTYDPIDEKQRMDFFNQQQQKINELNLKNTQYSLGPNAYSDMTNEEFQSRMFGLQAEQNCENATLTYKPPDVLKIPNNIDYRDLGFVTPVKSQGSCGACYAFVAVGSLEAQYKRMTGKLVSLSEQQLIDCSYPQGNMHCAGGSMCRAYEYAASISGVATEESYPYEGDKGDGQCKADKSYLGSPVGGYLKIPSGDEYALKAAVGLIGPVATAFDGNPYNFRYYKNGIFSDPSCQSGINTLTHALTIIGYGTDENGVDYWLVKNSWGPSWGDKGYGKVLRGSNMCGIATMALFPVLYKNEDGTPRFDGPAATEVK